MNKTQKILVSLIITILALFSFSITSNAYHVGETMHISLDRYEGNPNMYCLEHHQHLSNIHVKKYTIVRRVSITGTVATDDLGHKVDNTKNARLAYIVGSKEEGYGKGSRKNAVWNYMGTWMRKVGCHFPKVKELHNNVHGSGTHLDSAAAKYEKRFNEKSGDLKNIEDKTDKNKIKGRMDGNTNNMIVGPFKWDFEGDIKDIVVKDKNGKKIDSVKFGRYEGKTFKIIKEKDIQSNKNFYIYVSSDEDVTKMTVTANATVEVKSAVLWFLKCHTASYQNMMIAEPSEKKQTISDTFTYKPQIFGTLDIVKVNKDNTTVKLENVEFLLKTKAGKYVKAKKQGNKYTVQSYGDEANATKFTTDSNGEIIVKKLLIGKYEAIETSNPNYGYEAVTEKDPKVYTVRVNAESKSAKKLLKNKQIYVKISGYVWEDITKDGKENKIIGKENDSIYTSDNDKLLSGITVRLMDRKTRQAVMTATTDSNGAYLFDNVEIEKIVEGDYYIEFEYDGITYQNVTPLKDGNKKAQNTSKAAEGTERDRLNNKFATIEGKGSEEANKGIAIGTDGTQTDLLYNIKTDNKTVDGTGTYTTATFDHTQNKEICKIKATTDAAGYNLKDVFTYGDTEIKYNNLGLYERSQPNISVAKDLENVKISVNGYENTYKYASRYKNMTKLSSDGFNAGVQWANTYGTKSYTRAVYKEDYQYSQEATTPEEKKLKIYVTYCIGIKNNSTTLKARVNSIADYFDDKYTLNKIGTQLDENGVNITQTLDNPIATSYTNKSGRKFKKIIIGNNSTIEPGKYAKIYVQLQLNNESLNAIMVEKDALQNELKSTMLNFAEINSYSILQDNGKPYAGIDEKSNPGNLEPGNEKTYENDTDKAPDFKIEVANPRQMGGTVFVDKSITEGLQQGKIREGNRRFDDGEETIGDVIVTFKQSDRIYKTKTANEDIEGSIETRKATEEDKAVYNISDDEFDKTYITEITSGDKAKQKVKKGDYIIDGFIPGDYTLTYTWGDETYKVQDYKSTNYYIGDQDTTRKMTEDYWNKASDWYRKENKNIRFSDAVDDWGQREEIDKQTKTINNGLWKTDLIKTIDAKTPNIAIGVEIVDTEAIKDDLHYQQGNPQTHSIKNIISGIDFGITRRPMQQLAIEKRVSRIKATLANGQVIVDARVEIDKDGNAHLVGDYKYTTYMQPDANNKGFVKLELDNELIQGTKLEVEYTIKVVNQSELDYDSKEFYYYGEQKGNIVTLTPSKIVDYLDSGWAFEEARNTEGGWLTKQQNDIKDLVNNNVLNEEISKIGSRIILLTEKLKDIKLEPTKGKDTATLPLKVSKVLASSDEISLDNDTEILQIEKPFGSITTSKPGNYIPGVGAETADGKTDGTEADDSQAEPVIVTPATGENRDYIMPIVVGTIALIILGAGVVIIKKKTLTKE